MTVDVIGPFEYHAVVVNGYRVPYLTAEPANGGKVFLTLDSRYMIDIAVADFDRMMDFIANCIAVAAGFTCHPGTEGAPSPISRTPFSRLIGLENG